VPVTRAFPNSRFVGFDIDATSLERARGKATKAGLSDRLSFELVAAEELPAEPGFDLIMAFNCVHDMANPRGALRGVRRTLQEGGAFLWSEANASDHLEENIGPMGRLLYAASTMHCMTVSLASDGEGIGTVLGPALAARMADEAGFSSFQRLDIKHPYHQLFLARK
jgi:ubiquinone/menaquinone biosynthesis C-methylase UbiE